MSAVGKKRSAPSLEAVKPVEHAGNRPKPVAGGAAKRPLVQLKKGSSSKAAPPAGPTSISLRGVEGLAPTEELLAHVDDLSSDDEAPKNTIGNVPLQWYSEYDHIGYDVSGQKIARKSKGDRIDAFLKSQDDPLHKWTIYDAENDEEIVLSKRDVQILKNLHSGTYAHPEFDPTAPQYNLTDLYSSEVEIHPMNSGTEPKRRFIPSKWEMRKVMRIAKAIKAGQYKRETAKPASARPLYLLWEADTDAVPGYAGARKGPPHIAAPKMAPPGHAASYNPPPEYLLTDAERAAWEAMDPRDRPTEFLPTRYACLRHVPLYKPGVKERFERCLDLYLCPRAMRDKLNVDPESLLPKLPDPAELRPFPTTVAVQFSGHTSRVRSISVDPTGAWLVSGGDDKTVRLWDVATGRCVRTWTLAEVPQQVAWCPNAAIALVAVAEGEALHLLYPGTAAAWNAQSTFDALRGHRQGEAGDASARGAKAVAADSDVSDGDSDDEEEDGEEGSGEEGEGGSSAAARARKRLQNGRIAGSKADGADGGTAGGKGRKVMQVDDAGEVAEGAAGGEEGSDAEAEAGAGSDSDDEAAAAAAKGVAFRTTKWVQHEAFPASAKGLLLRPGATAAASGVLLSVKHANQVKRLHWHAKGDYAVSVCPGAPTGAVMIHQISKRASQCPFAKNKGLAQTAAFHPTKPLLYVANQHTVRIYNLQEEALESKLESGVKWISSMDIHPSGDHLILGSFDHRTVWFDTELSQKPFKTLRYHTKGVRRVAFHRSAPLMATASDDGTLHVFHSRVYDDFGTNPLIVPVKILRGHSVSAEGLGVLDAVFHPTQPWLFSAGADGAIKLWHSLP